MRRFLSSYDFSLNGHDCGATYSLEALFVRFFEWLMYHVAHFPKATVDNPIGKASVDVFVIGLYETFLLLWNVRKPIAVAQGLIRILLHLASCNFVESCSVMLLKKVRLRTRSPGRFIENDRTHGTDSSSSVHITRLAKQKKTWTTHFIHLQHLSFFFQLFPWGSSVFPTLLTHSLPRFCWA